MFGIFKRGLNLVAEALAPPPSTRLAEFEQHWKGVVDKICAAGEAVPLQSTGIPGHLYEMIDILAEEEKEAGEMAPCFEMLLRTNVLHSLAVFADKDRPIGINRLVLRVIAKLLRTLKQPMLPHVTVHRPLCKLVAEGASDRLEGLQREYAEFLLAVCEKFVDNPVLIRFFVAEDESGRRPSIAAGSPAPKVDPAKSFPLFTALVKYLASDDERVHGKALRAILICLRLPSDSVAAFVANHSSACEDVVARLASLHAQLPTAYEPQELAQFTSYFPQPLKDDLEIGGKFTPVLAYLSWLAICSEISSVSRHPIPAKISRLVATTVVRPMTLPAVRATAESTALTATHYLTLTLRHVTCPVMLDAILEQIVGAAGDAPLHTLAVSGPEGEAGATGAAADGQSQQSQQQAQLAHSQAATRALLIERCDANSVFLARATLLLFDEMLSRHSLRVMDTLVWQPLTQLPCFSGQAAHADGFYNRATHAVVAGFLSLVPEIARVGVGAQDHSAYFWEAHHCYVEACKAARGWPEIQDRLLRPPTAPEAIEKHVPTSTAASAAAADSQGEGPFLRVLLNKLERLLDEPYEINLIVTSILARIALYPHVASHAYFLDPSVSLPEGVSSLFQSLRKVAMELNNRAQRIEDFKANLERTWRMYKDGPDDDDDPIAAYNMQANGRFIEAALVFGEFCKEMAAIALVKAGVPFDDACAMPSVG